MVPPLHSLSIPSRNSGGGHDRVPSLEHDEREPLSTVSTNSSNDLTHPYGKERDSATASLLPRHRSSSTSSRQPTRLHHSLVRRIKDNGWVLFAFALGCLLGQAGWRWRSEAIVPHPASMLLKADDVRAGVWSAYGQEGAVPVGTKVSRPAGMPECERTLLFDWSRFQYGFGSTATSLLQAAFFAHANNYTMLFSRGANPYGTYLDYFSPAPLSCWPREEHYDPDWYLYPKEGLVTAHAYVMMNQDQQGWVDPRTVDRVIVNTDDLYPLNWFAGNQTFDFAMLDSLPDMSATTPLAPADNVPKLFRQRFFQYSAAAREHFTLNPMMQSRVGEMVRKYGLDSERDVPTVGVHYRGGDKLWAECRPSSKLSCGNITLHCETALISLTSISHPYPSFDLSTISPTSPTRPRMLLMTAEPDALDKFQADSVCQRFEIEELPRKGGDKPFLQAEWKELSESVRLEDTRMLLTQGDLLANYVDATVVSANSNSARIMQVRAGPKRVIDEERIRTVDYYWHPMQFPPYKGRCDGRNGNCYPE